MNKEPLKVYQNDGYFIYRNAKGNAYEVYKNYGKSSKRLFVHQDQKKCFLFIENHKELDDDKITPFRLLYGVVVLISFVVLFYALAALGL